MSRLIKILFWLLVSANSCCRPTDIHSSFDLERNELLNRMEIIERIYIWNNFKTAIEYPELILEGVFEGLPKEWRELKRLIRKSQFYEAYLIIENDSVDISWSLRYAAARFGFYEIASSFYRHFEDSEEAAWKNHNLGHEQWFMWDYPVYGIHIMNPKYIDMETFFDILLLWVLLALSTLPIILTVSLIMLRKMYNDWKKYISEL